MEKKIAQYCPTFLIFAKYCSDFMSGGYLRLDNGEKGAIFCKNESKKARFYYEEKARLAIMKTYYFIYAVKAERILL